MKKRKFKAESKQLLELMINSIYSNKDVFLRELISNASDACDKRHFYSIQDQEYKYDELFIEIKIDKENKTITLIDSGIGMNEEDIEKNIGTIAKSGSKEFIQKLEEGKENVDLNIIGQFGVGFYSSFIVANKVEVITKKPGNKTYKWSSLGVENYTIEEVEEKEVGTEIILYLKDDEESLSFLDENVIESLVKKYSDYVKYPIYMDMMVEEKVERRVLNSQKAIWKKDKKDVKKEEYNEFYKSKYNDFENPIHKIHSKVEGSLNYELLFFIPKNKPFDYNSPTYKKGIDLYSKGILIDNSLDYLIPDYFNFVKGLVDSEDLNLNISREVLQKDLTVTKLTAIIEKKIQKELLTLQKKKREVYNEIFDNFGRTIIFGMYDNFGQNKDNVKDLVMFKSSKEKEYTTFLEYIENNKDQEEIYYATGESIEAIEQIPVMEKVHQKGIEVLYLLNDVDEFALQMLMEYEGKKFKSIANADFDISTEEEKEKLEEKTKENEDLLKGIKEALKDKVSDVVLTNNLTDSAVCLSSRDGVSLEMEKLLSKMPDGTDLKAQKVLEINPNHKLFKAISKIKDGNINEYANVLYNNALVLEGFKIDNPKEYLSMLDEIIIKSIN